MKSYAKRAPSFEIDQLAPPADRSLEREAPDTLEDTSLDSETSQISEKEEDSIMAKP